MTGTDYEDEEAYVAQMRTGALLNPRMDSTFKALFSQPTPESRGALHSFLEAATEHKIASFELTANDAPDAFDGQRGVSYDIQCVFDDGQAADIEMQAFNQAYDYGKRAEYQVARLETTYLQKGDNWEKAPTVYQITVLDFNYAPKGRGGKETISRYAMRTKDGRELANALNVIFIELPKAGNLETSVDSNTPLENWALFFKNADNPVKQDVIQRLTKKEAGLMQAQKSLSTISANRDLWIAQYRQEMRERDYRSGLSAAERKGLEKGIAQGERNKAMQTARVALAMGMATEQIVQLTGLSAAEVAHLQDDRHSLPNNRQNS